MLKKAMLKNLRLMVSSFVLAVLLILTMSTHAADTYNPDSGIVYMPVVTVGNDTYNVFMQHQGDLVFQVDIATPTMISAASPDTYDESTGVLRMPYVVVGDDVFDVEMMHQGNLVFSVTSANLVELQGSQTLQSHDTAEIDVNRGSYTCVDMDTNYGNIRLALDEKYAPTTVSNFKQYADEGFYDGLIFHRVIADFMIQGGGFDAQMAPQSPREAIINESNNGLKNYRGRIAMARTSKPHTATSQFFINTKDNSFLDFGSNWGYAVFGGVISGMDVVEQIESVQTATVSDYQDVPVNAVSINSVVVVDCPLN